MPLDHTVTLGRSGLRVSPFCLGAMTFGLDWGWGSDPDESRRIIDRYTQRGGNFIDTANIYTKGHSEKIIGDHIGRDRARRDRLVIATKFMGNLFPGDPNGGGAGRKSIAAACEESLRRLQTDYIDLYWMHFWDRFTPMDETMRALDDLVRAGKVRYIGFSDTPAWKCVEAQMLARLHAWSPVIALQVEYSLLERTVEGDLVPMAREFGMGITPWSPLKGGLLSGKYTRAGSPTDGRGSSPSMASHLTERFFSLMDVLSTAAKEAGTTPAAVSLAWVQNRPGVASTIIGARTLKQLDENLDALDVRLSPEHTARLDEATRPILSFPHGFLEGAITVTLSGSTVNGVSRPVWDLAPKSDQERW